MKIAVGADHAGFPAKEAIKKWLVEMGHDVVDFGCDSYDSVDYPDFAEKVARFVAEDHHTRRGVLVCGTGIGIGIAANKIAGIRAATCHDEFTARMSRAHNDANVLCMGARVLAVDRMEPIVREFFHTPFDGGRHDTRIEKIARLEREGSSGSSSGPHGR